MCQCEDKLARKTSHHRLPSVAQNVAYLSSLLTGLNCGSRILRKLLIILRRIFHLRKFYNFRVATAMVMQSLILGQLWLLNLHHSPLLSTRVYLLYCLTIQNNCLKSVSDKGRQEEKKITIVKPSRSTTSEVDF